MASEPQAQGQAPAAPTPPATPTPAAPTPVAEQVEVAASPGVVSPSAVYEGMVHQRRELLNQLERLNDQREEIADEITEAHTNGVTAGGLEARLLATDERISSVEAQLAIADAQVARAAAVPGAVVPPPPRPPEPGPPEEFWVLSGIFMFVVVFPMAIAYSRRIWRRGAAVATQLPQEIWARFTRMEQGLDAVAIEVERIGEGQRYLTRLYSEKGLGAGPAQPVQTPERLGEIQNRR